MLTHAASNPSLHDFMGDKPAGGVVTLAFGDSGYEFVVRCQVTAQRFRQMPSFAASSCVGQRTQSIVELSLDAGRHCYVPSHPAIFAV